MKSFGNVYILGDSYSTFEGYIPYGYPYYFSFANPEDRENDVREAYLTWWHKLLKETGSKLVRNNSWSGSTICYMGYAGYYPEQSFVKRAEDDIANGIFSSNKIDTVFIMGASNDSWNDSPIGSVKKNIEEITPEDRKCCLCAFCEVLSMIKKAAPDTRIITIINKPKIKAEITEGMIEACRLYGAEYIALRDFEIFNNHPTAKGMEEIKNQIKDIAL